MFKKSKNISIHGGNFTAITNKKGKDIWRKHIAPGAFHNSRERLEYDPPKCHPETRVVVIQAIIDWIEDGQKTTFIKWLNGAAGVGKSAIAQEIAELCDKSGRLAASFFWSRSAAGRNDEGRLIASLAYQLLTIIPQLRGPFETAVELDPYLFTRSLQTQMDSLIIQPLNEVFESDQQEQVDTPMVIILDGLDECGKPEAQQYILRLIADSVSKFPIPLCFLIVSRPEKAIRDSFNDQPLLAFTDRLTLDEKYRPDDDIRLFLVESFESVKRTHELRLILPPVWPSHEDIDSLVRKSSGQFIYAATVVKFVKSSRQRPNKQLGIILGVAAAGSATPGPFAELDALYCRIFSLVLKEDLEKALEIISLAMFLEDDCTARQIETILSYPHGELQRILIDLHSILHIPALKCESEENEDKLHILHASLRDFLCSSSRSKHFHLDEGIAREHIARHFLRYIREHSDEVEDRYSCDHIIFEWLDFMICDRSLTLTTELLLDCFEFDPVKWVSRLIQGFGDDYQETVGINYIHVVELHQWFQHQEAYVLEHLGPTRSFNARHSLSWKVAFDLICGEMCCILHGRHPKRGGNVATALTHPDILIALRAGYGFESVFGVGFYFFDFFSTSSGHSGMVAIQEYLRDKERAGLYFVDGGRYASLCMHLLKVLLASRHSSGDEPGKQKENGRDETSNSMDDDHMPRPDDEGASEFAIVTLPFHLSYADYNPTLAELARSMVNRKMGKRLPRFRAEIELLNEAIDLYLKKESLTPNEIQAVSERFEVDKRRRESDDSLEGSTAQALNLTSKRTKVMDELGPVEDLSKVSVT